MIILLNKTMSTQSKDSLFGVTLRQFANTHGSSRHSKATTHNLEAATQGIATFFGFDKADVVLAGNTESASGPTQLLRKMMEIRDPMGQRKFHVIHTADFGNGEALVEKVKEMHLSGQSVFLDISYDARFYIKKKADVTPQSGLVSRQVIPLSMADFPDVKGMIVPANDKPGGQGGMAVLVLKKGFYDEGLALPPAVPGGGTVDAVIDPTYPVYSKSPEKEVGGSPATLRMAKMCDAVYDFNPLSIVPVLQLDSRGLGQNTTLFHHWKARSLQELRQDMPGDPKENQNYFDYTASAKPDGGILEVLSRIERESPRDRRKKAEEAATYVVSQLGGRKGDVLVPNGAGATGPFNLLVARVKESLLRQNPNAFLDPLLKHVVFLSKREHHSNILPWLEAGFEICQIGLTSDGLDDYEGLRSAVDLAQTNGRSMFISWSASSNVTSVKADLECLNGIASLYSIPVFLDLAAHVSHHPYRFSEHSQVKAVVIAGHKNHGGPGSCGALVVKGDYESILLKDEDRHLVQTGVGELPLIQLALTFKLMQDIGMKKIEKIEMAYAKRIMEALKSISNVEIMGPSDLKHRGSIIAFNIRVSDAWVGDKLVINDRCYIKPGRLGELIEAQHGIIGRAGCSCAGPYGVELLGLTEAQAEAIQKQIAAGDSTDKPGWFRLRADFLKTEEDVTRLIEAVRNIAGQYES